MTWGFQDYGGDSSSVQSQLTNVAAIYSKNSAFAAQKEDVAFGNW